MVQRDVQRIFRMEMGGKREGLTDHVRAEATEVMRPTHVQWGSKGTTSNSLPEYFFRKDLTRTYHEFPGASETPTSSFPTLPPPPALPLFNQRSPSPQLPAYGLLTPPQHLLHPKPEKSGCDKSSWRSPEISNSGSKSSE